MDTPVAIKATASELACLSYLMVTEGQEYVRAGHLAPTRSCAVQEALLISTAKPENSGFELVPKMQAPEKQNPMLSIA